MFYVLVINQDGKPGKLHGPIDWQAAIELIRTNIAAETPITQDMILAIDTDGQWQFEDGGGIYILQAE